MADFNSKYTGQQVEDLLDQVASGNVGGGGGGITVETDPIFSASPAAAITEEKIAEWNSKSAQGDKGDKGDTGVGVASVAQTTTSNADGGSNVVTVTLTDGTKSTFIVKNGSKGSQGEKGDKGDTGANGTNGVSVSSVKQTTTSTADGGTNVVTVTLSNGTTSTFNVKNGSKGGNGTNGTNGKDGTNGADGATFTPSVDSAGNLSWSNNKGLANPPTVNIKGPKGDSGEGGSGSSGGMTYVEDATNANTQVTIQANQMYAFKFPQTNGRNVSFAALGAGQSAALILPYKSGSVSLSHRAIGDIIWADDDPPVFEDGWTYEIQLLGYTITNPTDLLVALGCWGRYPTPYLSHGGNEND